MTKSEHNAAAYVLATHGDPWAIDVGRMKGYLNTLIVSDMSAEEIEARTGPSATRMAKTVVVMRLTGPITQRASLFSAFFGGTSTEKFRAEFDAMNHNHAIGGIVVDIDSPGGTVAGVPELAEHIFATKQKPIVGVANTWAASAAFWIASAFDSLNVAPSGEVGGVGVVAMHTDVSAMAEAAGVKVTLISAGTHKVEGNPHEPLGDEARAQIQRGVDHFHGRFEAALAKNHGIKVNAVQKTFGQGRMVRAKEAVAAGMAARVATLDQTIERMQRRLGARATARAEAVARDAELRELELGGHRIQVAMSPAEETGG